jgi:hypothetical protein
VRGKCEKDRISLCPLHLTGSKSELDNNNSRMENMFAGGRMREAPVPVLWFVDIRFQLILVNNLFQLFFHLEFKIRLNIFMSICSLFSSLLFVPTATLSPAQKAEFNTSNGATAVLPNMERRFPV